MKKEPKVIDRFIASNGFVIEYAPDESADVPMTDKELKNAKPVNAKDILPPEFFEAIAEIREIKQRGRPPQEHHKQRITLRLDDNIVTTLRSTGKGWQTRLNDFLNKAIEQKLL